MAGRDDRKILDVRIDYRRLTIALVVAGLILWFALANRHEVTITWWVVDLETSLIAVIIVSALLGGIADRLLQRRRSHRA